MGFLLTDSRKQVILKQIRKSCEEKSKRRLLFQRVPLLERDKASAVEDGLGASYRLLTPFRLGYDGFARYSNMLSIRPQQMRFPP